MKQFISEFIIALLICWLAFAALSGCAVDQQEAYNIIAGQPTKTVQWKHQKRGVASNYLNQSINQTKGN